MTFSHAALAHLPGMGEHGPLGGRLSCPCQACWVWRRLGEELHLGHQSQAFIEVAGKLLREVFDLVLAKREQLRLDVWRPLAEGSPGAEEKKEEPAEEEPAKSKKRRRRRSGTSKVESPEVERRRRRHSSEEKEKPKRSRSRRRRQGAAKSSSSAARSRGGDREAGKQEGKESPTKVKKETTEADRKRQEAKSEKGEGSPERKGSTKALSGRPSSSLRPPLSVSPSPTTRRRKQLSEKEERRRDTERSQSGEGRERPPGLWTLRPAEPSRSPRGSRPPEPPGPPPGWKGPGRGSTRSKGVVRRERQTDIWLFGPSAARKKEREDRHRA